MLTIECGDGFVHMPDTKRQRQRDAQGTAQFAVLLQQRCLGLVEVRKNACTVLIEILPGIGDLELARGATQQLYADALLERRDAPADGRFRGIQAVRGGRKAAGLDHG